MRKDISSLIESILACPKCLADLRIEGADITCIGCGASFKKKDGKYYFRSVSQFDRPNLFDKFKSFFKKFHRLYSFLVMTIAPTMKLVYLKKRMPSGEDDVILEIGSGNSNTDERWIKVDYFDYPNVNIVCDCENLPIKDNSVDAHYNVSVLEHVPSPSKVVFQIYRTLKKGGIVVSSVPFMMPYHASPHDYHRFTSSGVLNLFQNFKKLELGVRSGPVSALLFIFQEMTASIFSFGIMRLRYVLLILLYLFLFPLKLLDLIFLLYPFRSVEGIASNFYYVGMKE